MTDKAHDESGWRPGRLSPVARKPARGCVASRQEPWYRRSNAQRGDGRAGLKTKRLLQLSFSAVKRENAAAPYFIHIVRANRAQDMFGHCPGVSQVGPKRNQTVAG